MIDSIKMPCTEFIIRPIVSSKGLEYNLYKKVTYTIRYTKWFSLYSEYISQEDRIYLPTKDNCYGHTISEIIKYIKKEYGQEGLNSITINELSGE